MALNYNLERIKNPEQTCFMEANADIPDSGVKKGDTIMNPVTNMLIWSTIAVGLGEITEANAAEFYARLSLTESLDGPFLIRPQEDGTMKPHAITPEEVRAHIGLSCNVTPEKRGTWLKRISRELDLRVQRYERAIEKAAAA